MSKIEAMRNDLLKFYNIVYSTENMFDRELKVPYLCGDIDQMIEKIENAQTDIATGLYTDDPEILEEKVEEAEYELHGLTDQLDSLRDDIEKLRSWGQSWKDFARQLIEENDIKLEDYSELLYHIKEGGNL